MMDAVNPERGTAFERWLVNARSSRARPDSVECAMRRIIIASIVALLPTCVAAAELPKKTTAPPRDAKVTPCPAYGAGFVRVEGSTTCIKVGGTVRVETTRSR